MNDISFDGEIEYSTKGIVEVVGRAIAISLNDAKLPGNAYNKHMTVLFRKNKRWKQNEIESIAKETDRWMKEKYGDNKTSITFTIHKYGNKSVEIKGDLSDLCLYLRSVFKEITNNKQRIPHCELFNTTKKQKKPKDGNKIRAKLERMISKTKEIELLYDEEQRLKDLLNNINGLNEKTLRNEIKNIAKSMREKNKTLKNERKQQRKLKKEERKQLKQEKIERLNAARFESLPLNKNEIGLNPILYIHIDGYNIIGCDPFCRKNMRKRNGGIKKARSRLIMLIQKQFIERLHELNLDYAVMSKVWFDGNGINYKDKDIEIEFSTKKQIVDDKLVEIFSNNKKKENSNILVITSDKEFTLRLYDIGVKVIKSSTFYKTFLKENENENENENEKKEDIESDEEFTNIMSSKMNSIQNEEDDEFNEIFGDDIDDMDLD